MVSRFLIACALLAVLPVPIAAAPTLKHVPALTNIEHSYLVQAASEGVGMYFSSGDGSGVEAPSSDPDAIAVGGTTLGIGKTSNRLFETGWSTVIALLDGTTWEDLGEQGAAGGGPSLLWAQPGYQKGVVPASLADIFAGLKLTVGFALIGAIVGEFMSSSDGLGHAIFKAGSLYVIPKVFAALVATIALALVLTFLVGKIERLLMPWRRQL